MIRVSSKAQKNFMDLFIISKCKHKKEDKCIDGKGNAEEVIMYVLSIFPLCHLPLLSSFTHVGAEFLLS